MQVVKRLKGAIIQEISFNKGVKCKLVIPELQEVRKCTKVSQSQEGGRMEVGRVRGWR